MSAFWPVWLPDPSILLALAVVGATSASLGCFAVLRRQSLLGDTLAHAALPGIGLAFWLTEAKSPLVLLLGAMATGLLGAALLFALKHASRLKEDAALGLVLSTFFGVGIVILTRLQNEPEASQSGLDHFIYGQAAYLTWDHARLMLGLGMVVLVCLALTYKECKLLSFDPAFAASLGLPRRRLEALLAGLTVVGVMLSLRAVGVVLTVALLIGPDAAARQWTQRLSTMMGLAIAFGISSSWLGAIWSQTADATPTGPAIVLVASVLLVVSILVAPGRGLWWHYLRLRQHRRDVAAENVLADFYRHGERQGDRTAPMPAAELADQRGLRFPPLERTMRDLCRRGLAESAGDGWRLTEAGADEAARVMRSHRLWELYLARRLDLPLDHVHRDAEEMEHALPSEIVAELDAHLGHPRVDPHGHPIPRLAAEPRPTEAKEGSTGHGS
ncbi:MAG TPA: iron chelate uptake ABC transporter family permease subunit [Gemmatales bacterium]|nr:iron chelate uptake ABC transporter family permease subunit [Gemmatales bacterium]